MQPHIESLLFFFLLTLSLTRSNFSFRLDLVLSKSYWNWSRFLSLPFFDCCFSPFSTCSRGWTSGHSSIILRWSSTSERLGGSTDASSKFLLPSYSISSLHRSTRSAVPRASLGLLSSDSGPSLESSEHISRLRADWKNPSSSSSVTCLPPPRSSRET